MDFWIGLLGGICIGCIIGAHHTGRARRYWQWRLARKLQLIALRNEMKGYRHKRRRPVLNNWRKCLLGWLHSITPSFTRYTNFRPATLVGWHRRFVKRWWWMLVVAGKRRAAGRPRIDASVEKIIIDIKAANPSHWVAQQIRDAYPFDEAPEIMLMDHDSIFVPVMNKTLPNMGIKVVRTSVGCPKQARPHRANDGQSPIQQENAANDVSFAPGTLRAEAIPWLIGLHHSYRRAA